MQQAMADAARKIRLEASRDLIVDRRIALPTVEAQGAMRRQDGREGDRHDRRAAFDGESRETIGKSQQTRNTPLQTVARVRHPSILEARQQMISPAARATNALHSSDDSPRPVSPASGQLAKVRREFVDHRGRGLLRDPEFLGGKRDGDDRRSQTQIDELRQPRIRSSVFAFSEQELARERQSVEFLRVRLRHRFDRTRERDQSRFEIISSNSAIFGVSKSRMQRCEMMPRLSSANVARPRRARGRAKRCAVSGSISSQASSATLAAIKGGRFWVSAQTLAPLREAGLLVPIFVVNQTRVVPLQRGRLASLYHT